MQVALVSPEAAVLAEDVRGSGSLSGRGGLVGYIAQWMPTGLLSTSWLLKLRWEWEGHGMFPGT